MTQSIYLKDTAAGVYRALQIAGSVPGTATTGTGWIVDSTAPTAYSQMASNVERLAATFTATPQPPDSGPDATIGDGFRSENVINGFYAAGSWTIPIPVIRVTAGTTADGRVRVRLWRSPNADGSAATEITTTTAVGTTVTNLTNVEQISTVTVTLTEFGLVDEYLFLSVAWEITGVGGGATDDVDIRVGTSGTIVAQDFTTATTTEYQVVLAGRGLVVKKGDYLRQLAQQFAAQLSTTATTGVRLGELTKVMTGYAGGSGFPNFDPDNPTRYYQGYGVDVTATKDKAQAGPGLTASRSSANNAARVFGQYNSQLYVGYSTGQVDRQTATDTWSAAVGTITSNRAVTGIRESAYTINNVTARAWIANGVNAQLASYDGTTFTNNAADANVGTRALTYISCLGDWSIGAAESTSTSKGNVIIGGKETATGQAIIGAAHSSTTTWVAASTWIGGPNLFQRSSVGLTDVTAMLAAADGGFLWAASNPSTIAGELWREPPVDAANAASDFQFEATNTLIATLSDDYITALAELNGVVYALGAAGRLYRVDSNKLVQVAGSVSPTASETLYGMTVWGGALWISCRVGTALLVRRYGPSDPADSASTLVWSDPIYGGAIDASATAARQLTTFGGFLYAATEAAGASVIYRMDDAVYNTGPVTLQTGEITFDSATIVKSIKVEHSALVSGDAVTLKYARNGSTTFNSLGTNSTVGSTSTSYAVAASGGVTRLSIQMVIDAGASAATPQLGQLTIVVRPIGDVTREWTLTTEAWKTATLPGLKRKDGSTEPRTGQQIIDSLWNIFEEGDTQRFRDIDNVIYTVIIEDWQDAPQEELAHPDGLRWTGTLKIREV